MFRRSLPHPYSEKGLEVKRVTLQVEAALFFKTPDKSYPTRCKTPEETELTRFAERYYDSLEVASK